MTEDECKEDTGLIGCAGDLRCVDTGTPVLTLDAAEGVVGTCICGAECWFCRLDRLRLLRLPWLNSSPEGLGDDAGTMPAGVAAGIG